MTEKPARTRYAPSPTGPQHIGGVRTALFSWLYARHTDGQFILRLEDTDQSRTVEGALEYIVNALHWIGIDWDEGPDKGGPYGPYVQSERLELYQKWAQYLLDNDYAYKAFETPAELQMIREQREKQGLPPGYDGRARNLTPDEIAAFEEEGRDYVVRFKMPREGKTVSEDAIRGKVEFDNKTLQDLVLLKADGFPTYHLAHVVDDHFMEITHITRANEWLASLPYHWQIFEAFGWEKPVFAHLPVLLNPNGKGKLSKRHATFEEGGQRILVMAQDFINEGYLPEATRNFLTNIGWNFGDNQEIFTTEEAIERFELEDINDTNSAYPMEKLDWMNGEYIRMLDLDDFAQRIKPFFESAGYSVDDEERLKMTAAAIQTRIKTLKEAIELAGFIFADWATFEAPPADDLVQKKMDAARTVGMLEASIELIESLEEFSHDAQYAAFKDLAKQLEVKNGQLFGSIRVAVTGQLISPPTFETMEILGKDESLRRIRMAIDTLRKAVTE